jgi:4-hydroxybenzoate polyprenyltransferase
MLVVRLPEALPGRPSGRPTHPTVGDAATVRPVHDRTTVELTAQEKTVELPTANPKRRWTFVRELFGAVAAGMVVLAAIVLVLEVISWIRDVPGLGVVVLIGHLVGAALAILAQRQLDRREGRPAFLYGLGLGAVALAVLVLFWWS